MNIQTLNQTIKTLEGVRNAVGSFTRADVDLTLGLLRREVEAQATPPAAQRQWVGLTDEELLEAYGWSGPCEIDFIAAAARTELLGGLRKVEAKLKEKNT